MRACCAWGLLCWLPAISPATSPARAEGCLETALNRDCALSSAAAPCTMPSSFAASAEPVNHKYDVDNNNDVNRELNNNIIKSSHNLPARARWSMSELARQTGSEQLNRGMQQTDGECQTEPHHSKCFYPGRRL